MANLSRQYAATNEIFLHIRNQMWLRSSVMWVGMYRHFGATCYLCPEVIRVCLYAGLTVTWRVRNALKPCWSGGGIILCMCAEGAVTSPTLLDVPTHIAVSIYETTDVTSHDTCSVSRFFQSLKLGTFDTESQGASNPCPPRYAIILWVKYTNACCFYTCNP
jgi:hypothetical protein